MRICCQAAERKVPQTNLDSSTKGRSLVPFSKSDEIGFPPPGLFSLVGSGSRLQFESRKTQTAEFLWRRRQNSRKPTSFFSLFLCEQNVVSRGGVFPEQEINQSIDRWGCLPLGRGHRVTPLLPKHRLLDDRKAPMKTAFVPHADAILQALLIGCHRAAGRQLSKRGERKAKKASLFQSGMVDFWGRGCPSTQYLGDMFVK